MKTFTALVAATALFSSNIAQAQDEADSSDDGSSTVETLTLLSYLGLTAPDGKTTLDGEVGALEGYVLSAGLLGLAGEKIRFDLYDELPMPTNKEGEAVASKVVVLVGNEKLELATYYQVKSRIDVLEQSQSVFLKNYGSCASNPMGNKNKSGDPDTTSDPDKKEAAAFALKASDILGMIRADRTLKSVSVSPGAQMVVNAITSSNELKNAASTRTVNWTIPAEVGVIKSSSILSSDLFGVMDTISPYAAGKCDGLKNEARAKQIKADAAAIIAIAKTLIAPGKEGAPSLLENAIRYEGIGGSADSLKVLRVNVEKAGGTLMNKSNIWTTLGGNGVTMSGGLIITYRLLDPATGTINRSNSLICTTPMRSLKQINRKGLKMQDQNGKILTKCAFPKNA